MAALLFSISICNLVNAAVVTSTFSGVITAVNQQGQNGPSLGSVDGISIGQSFTAQFSYQTANSGADQQGSATQGLFSISPSAETFLTVNVNGRVFQKTTLGVLFVQTGDDQVSTLSNSTDFLSLLAITPSLPSGWSSTAGTYSTRLTFFDQSGQALLNDALPSQFSNLFSVGIFSTTFNSSVNTPSGNIDQLYIEGSLNMTAVPEPSTMILGACAALVPPLFARLRRSRRC